MTSSQILSITTVICILQISIALRYDTYRSNIESPRQFSLPDGLNWAKKQQNANIKDYNFRKYLSKLVEMKNHRLNNTIHTELDRKDSDEDPRYFPRHVNPFEDILKQNTSETRMHTYEYPHSNTGKGEILVHRPAPIIVRRPPTKVLINHPPLVVKPSPVIFHRPPPVVMRPNIIKTLPQRVRIEPKLVKMIQPTKKVLVRKNSVYEEEKPEGEYYHQRQNIFQKY